MSYSQNPFGNYASTKKERDEAKANELPSGTIPELKEWVGDDKDRAKRVLEAENANEKPRKSLVEHLEEVISE